MQEKAVGGLCLGPGASPAAGLAADGSGRWFADVLRFGGLFGVTEVYPSGLWLKPLVSLVSVCSWVSLEGREGGSLRLTCGGYAV